ncbi:MAG TPA: HlyD family efflux transporter periplasmic adaptor subunit, partial [Pirellula sp.]|nr:HlyD family efflux transporter periplasmic adaptor subunit [Pirellula sp.]
KLIVENAKVFFPDDSTVAAQSEGIILKLHVDDGTIIEAGAPMIEIDPRLAEAEVEVSEKELEAAQVKAKDDSNLKYSEAALEVAIKELEISNDLLRKSAEDYLANEKKRLENKKALFQVNVSKSEKKRDEADLGVKSAKLKASNIQVDLRKITAQRTGMVSEVAKRQFDFVRGGEIILKLTSMERLRITGNAKVTDSPHLLFNAPARVTIYYAEGKGETVEGIVGYVSPRSMGINTYKIHVDVPNRLTADGQYLFREGMDATIEVTPRTR